MIPKSAIDVHVHAGPSFFDRKHTAVELAREMREAGFDGFVLKSHFGSTHPVAGLTESLVSDVRVYSSIALNTFVGGLNPSAVELAIETDVRVIWLPTFSSNNHWSDRDFPFSGQTLTLVDEAGSLTSDAREVLETIVDADRSITIGNGHISREETIAVLDALESMGADNEFLITHPDFEFMGLSVGDQVEFAERGAVIEKCYLPVHVGDATIEDVADGIRSIGAEHCVLSTDHGQTDNDSPPTAYDEFVERLFEQGLTEGDVRQMAVETPRQVVGE